MIDLHTHIVPGVDDGAADPNEAVAMCRLAKADGTEIIVATPHQRHPRWENDDLRRIDERLAGVRAAVEGPEIRLGAEIHVGSDLLREVELLPGGSLLTLAGSRYLLLEFPPSLELISPRAIVHELTVAGWRPIIAHPERIRPWAEDPAELGELVDLGALLQLTAMSVTGEFRRRSQACSTFLLDQGWVHVVASDAHDPERRPPILSRAFEAVSRRWGLDLAERLFRDNPRRILADEVIEA
jgi:protein-tyrosine phosphatase